MLTSSSSRYRGRQECVSEGHPKHILPHNLLACIPFGSTVLDLLTWLTPYRPRKIDSIVNPYGFEFKGGKIIQVQDGAAGPSDDTKAAENSKDDNKKKAPKAPKPKGKARQGPSNKKRKLADSFPDEDGSDNVKEEDAQES